jgi:PIN domain nuclease of toxin-antitoxin system
LNELLLDTQVLVWIGANDRRLPQRVRDRLLDPDSKLFVSAVTAWEFADLEHRVRLPSGISLSPILELLSARLLDFPQDAWETISRLPTLHQDPVDRMVVGHAIVSGLTLVTGDAVMRRYPVKILW